MADKPHEIQHVVASVPHSGTRTLQTWLSESRPEVVPAHRDQVGHWHFSMHPKYIFEFVELGGDRMLYVPVRNPHDVADSWERRYGSATDKTAEVMCNAISVMVYVCECYAGNVEIFKMEDLPNIRGRGPGS
jgi:hypothetical protein